MSCSCTAEEAFIPFTVGGGIRTADDARRMLRAGADKVSVNTAAVQRPGVVLIGEIADEFGAQCVVCAIDAKRRAGGFEVYLHGGRTPTDVDAVAWAAEAAAAGAGEILLTSMDRDGTGEGFDLELTGAVVDAVGVSVIASRGVGTLEDLADGHRRGRRRRRAGRVDLPLPPAHDRRGQAGPGRSRRYRPHA